MKKLLVLSLVLGIASLATAGIDLGTIAGLSYEVSGNTVTVSGESVGGYVMSLKANDGSELSNAVVAAGFGSLNNPGAWYGSYGQWIGASASNTSDVAGVIFSIDFTPGATELEFVYGFAGQSEIVMGGQTTVLEGYTMSLVTIPEPMTMGLLGLGGLFLARRKK